VFLRAEMPHAAHEGQEAVGVPARAEADY
jgi:hypothetical protein